MVGAGPLAFFVWVAPELSIYPANDAAFHADVHARRRSAATPHALEAALRASYPRAVVRKRELADTQESWYVYRDGSFIADGIDEGTRDN